MKWRNRLFRALIWLALLGVLTVAAGAAGIYLYFVPRLPDTEQLREVRFQVPLRVYSGDGRLIAEFGEKRRIPVAYGEVPERMIQAFLAAEDDRFFRHPGVDYQGLARAAVQLLLTGERRQGGSTITMQVARNFFLTREKTFTRKINEILLALKIERELSKEDILQLYVNKIYLGHRAYGIGAAAQVYYGRPVGELDLAQTAMIAGLPKAPSRLNPISGPERAVERRNYVLGRMADLGFITEAERRAASDAPITASLHAAEIELEAPYAAEMVRAEMIERFGSEAYTAGYRVFTTLDTRLQRAANPALRSALDEYAERHGYLGAERHYDLPTDAAARDLEALLDGHEAVGGLVPGLVLAVSDRSAEVLVKEGERVILDWEGMSWARPRIDENRRGAAPKTAGEILQPGDLVRVRRLEVKAEGPEGQGEPGVRWRLAQVPEVEGALVSLDPDSGAIRALVGGYDFFRSKFNRVTQAERQPGSGFKPFVYSAALEAGFTPASLINDAPVVFDDPSLEGAWRPENYSGKFFGPTRLRVALKKSRNLVSIRLLRAVGIERALEHIARFGFDPQELPRNLSLALGSANVTPLQQARGFAVLANGGYLIEPYLVERIEVEGRGPVFEADPLRVCEACDAGPKPAATDGEPAVRPPEDEPPRLAPRVISPENHYMMNSMMRDVVQSGTAVRARELGRSDLAGKTGTTNEQRDAWFNGFHPSLVAVVWVGFDDSSPLGRGETGGRAALPAWIAYMREALEGVPEELPPMPSGLVTVRIDPDTGRRAPAGQADAVFEVFRADNVPEMGGSAQTAGPARGETGVVESLF